MTAIVNLIGQVMLVFMGIVVILALVILALVEVRWIVCTSHQITSVDDPGVEEMNGDHT